MEELRNMFILFMIYSLIGWIIEIIDIYILSKKVINRGFLIGPYCPIYGIGAILMTWLLKGTTDFFGILVKSMVICAILEYLTSYLMEKIFKIRWWDYTQNKFNINGRICLETMVLFGLGGCLMVKFSNPFLYEIISNCNPIVLNSISIILAVILLMDIIVSLKIINKIKYNEVGSHRDSTEEIKEKVKNALFNSYLVNRLTKAFPNIKK